MKVKNFKPLWKKLKPQLTDLDFEFFYKIIDINGIAGRQLYPGCGREDNPRFYTHWFAHGRCHWNVALPCFIMNRRNLIGTFKIITNDKHSAIINTLTGEIYDPTYVFNEKLTLDQLEDYKIVDLFVHVNTISLINSTNILKFAQKYYHKDKLNKFIDIMEEEIKKNPK